MPVFNQSRSRIIRAIFLASFIVLIAQLFHLQVVSREYKRQADINAIFTKLLGVALPPGHVIASEIAFPPGLQAAQSTSFPPLSLS